MNTGHNHPLAHFVGKAIELGLWVAVGFAFAVGFVYITAR